MITIRAPQLMKKGVLKKDEESFFRLEEIAYYTTLSKNRKTLNTLITLFSTARKEKCLKELAELKHEHINDFLNDLKPEGNIVEQLFQFYIQRDDNLAIKLYDKLPATLEGCGLGNLACYAAKSKNPKELNVLSKLLITARKERSLKELAELKPEHINHFLNHLNPNEDINEQLCLFAIQYDNNLATKLYDKFLTTNQEKWHTLFFNAIKYNNRPLIQKIMNKHSADKYGYDYKAMMELALYYSVVHGNLNTAREILKYEGIKVDLKDEHGSTALHVAVKKGQIEILKEILKITGIDVNAIGYTILGSSRFFRVLDDDGGKTPLQIAIEEGRIEVLNVLLSHKEIKTDAQSSSGIDAIHFAAVWGNAPVLRELLTRGIDAHARDKKGRTALHRAVLRRNVRIVRALLNTEIDVHMKDEDGCTAMHYAVQVYPNKKTIRELLAAGIDVNAIDKESKTALHYAAMNGKEEAIRELHYAGIDANARDKDGKTALHYVAREYPMGSDEAVVRALLDAGIDVHHRDKDGKTALDYAKIVVHPVNKSGWTALHRAACCQKEVAVMLLLRIGINVHATDESGRTALHLAAENDNVRIFRDLLDAGIDINARDKDGKTALHYATKREKVKVIRELLNAGIDINAQDRNGRTVLHYVAQKYSRYSDKKVIRALLDAGIDINAQDKDGKTALHYAAQKYPNKNVIRVLLKAGTDVYAKDKNNKTALDLAKEENHRATIQMLERVIKEKNSKSTLQVVDNSSQTEKENKWTARVLQSCPRRDVLKR